MLNKDLQKLGFGKNMSAIYLSLFEFGEAKAGEIIKKVGLHRNLVYSALDKLEEKKLITKSTARGVAKYKALDPTRLMGELKEKEILTEQIIDRLKSIETPHAQEVIISEGLDEIRTREIKAFESLEKGDSIYYLGVSPSWFEIMGQKNIDKLIDLQSEAGFFLKGIGGHIGKNEKKYAECTPNLSQWKTIPAITSKEIETTILSDSIYIKIYIEPYTLIEIKNSAIAKNYKKYFDLLWKQETQTYTGWEEIERLFIDELAELRKPGDTSYEFGGGYGIAGQEDRIENFYVKYHTKCIKKKCNIKVIFYEQHKERSMREMTRSGDPDLKFSELSYIPASYYTPLQIHIVANKAIILIWGENPTATVYEREDVVAGFKRQFDLLCNIAKK